MAETWIEKLEDSPVYDYGKSVYQSIYKESIFVGYRYFDKVGIEPLFPFGYGLSYTTFTLSHLEIKLLFCIVSSNLNLYIVLFDFVSDFSCKVV